MVFTGGERAQMVTMNEETSIDWLCKLHTLTSPDCTRKRNIRMLLLFIDRQTRQDDDGGGGTLIFPSATTQAQSEARQGWLQHFALVPCICCRPTHLTTSDDVIVVDYNIIDSDGRCRQFIAHLICTADRCISRGAWYKINAQWQRTWDGSSIGAESMFIVIGDCSTCK